MSSSQSKIILVTGASKGIGRACSVHLSERGYTVYGTSRHSAERDRSEEPPSPALAMVQMDVNSDESVAQGIQRIIDKEQRLDVVINNAGFGYSGSVEDTSIDEAKHLFETNLWGTLRVCRAVLPVMRAQRSGMILNMSSLGGLIAMPFQGLYSASKFALEGVTESLRMEVRPFGIDVVLVEPGDVTTGFETRRLAARASHDNPDYQEQFRKTLAIVERDEVTGIPPARVAKLVEKIIKSSSPRRRYRVARPFQRLAAELDHFLPENVMEILVKGHYGLRGK